VCATLGGSLPRGPSATGHQRAVFSFAGLRRSFTPFPRAVLPARPHDYDGLRRALATAPLLDHDCAPTMPQLQQPSERRLTGLPPAAQENGSTQASERRTHGTTLLTCRRCALAWPRRPCCCGCWRHPASFLPCLPCHRFRPPSCHRAPSYRPAPCAASPPRPVRHLLLW